ncbi:MAG TPA: pyridoxamine 5'-phosphate oxidase [Steroidobacteraceae bacterium]|jgi:pyridoxamine 5'-phosphate oxidase|nr:pyridoxamine 5'-phosphate oxidase [Steroidobacteraceae bacterium]
MSSGIKTYWTETLPEPLPANPLELAAQWMLQARLDAAQPNPNSMVLATVDARGFPSARVVLCKEIDASAGGIVFYTNYRSRKGRELEANRRAAAVFHWDHRHRQVRAEGQVETLSDAENDAYFRTRPWQSRLGAWASEQSQPVESRQALERSVAAAARRFAIPYAGPGSAEPSEVAVDVPRPPNWGGYRLRADAVELWVEGEFRIHDRARWTRSLDDRSGAGSQPPWSAMRLQP